MFNGEPKILLSTKASPNSKGFVFLLEEQRNPQPVIEKAGLSVRLYLTLCLPDGNMLTWPLTKGVEYFKKLLLGGDQPKTADSVDSVENNRRRPSSQCSKTVYSNTIHCSHCSEEL